MICGLWLLWQLKMVKLNHRVFQASEHNMLQGSIKWTVNEEDMKMTSRKEVRRKAGT